jgi:hypothetical protein
VSCGSRSSRRGSGDAVPKWHRKRLLQTDPLKALVIGDHLRELHERFEAFCRRSLYDINLLVLFLDAICLPVRPSGPKEG